MQRRGVDPLQRSEVEAFFSQDDEDDSMVHIELNDSRTLIGYIHGWEDPPYEDWIYFQEEDDTSGRIPRDMIKSITCFHDET